MYQREEAHYAELAAKVQAIAEDCCRRQSVKAIFSSRAKNPIRLREKMLRRASTRNYQSSEDVRRDAADLAGVRVAVYFPGDIDKIVAELNEIFIVRESRTFPEPTNHSKGRFSGYHAVHLRVLPYTSHKERWNHSSTHDIVEIQIASALMHAWAEVEHDLAYKPTTGELSDEETLLLDQINGLVIASEQALKLLQQKVQLRFERAEQAKTLFESERALHLFIESTMSTNITRSPQLEMLFVALRPVAASTPAGVGRYLKQVVVPYPTHPVEQLLNEAILENPHTIAQLLAVDFLGVRHRSAAMNTLTKRVKGLAIKAANFRKKTPTWRLSAGAADTDIALAELWRQPAEMG